MGKSDELTRIESELDLAMGGRAIKSIGAWLSRLEKALLLLASATVLVLMLLSAMDVLGRYLLNKPITGALEISQVLMVAIVFFAAPYATAAGEQFHMEAPFGLERRWVYSALALLAKLGIVGLFALISWQAVLDARLAYVNNQFTNGLLAFSTWPIKTIYALALVLMTVRLLLIVVSGIVTLVGRAGRCK